MKLPSFLNILLSYNFHYYITLSFAFQYPISLISFTNSASFLQKLPLENSPMGVWHQTDVKIAVSIPVIASISSTAMYSNLPWKFLPPVQRFGQGRPIKDSLAPSVPPRMGTVTGVIPTFSIAFFARSTTYIHGWIFSRIL